MRKKNIFFSHTLVQKMLVSIHFVVNLSRTRHIQNDARDWIAVL